MRIGQLAAAAGVSTDTIRYYERIGLLPSPRRTPAGYREYPAGAGNRLRVIRNAVQLGFPLQEVTRVLRIKDAGGAPCRQVRDYAQALVTQIEQRLAELESERLAMMKMIEEWDAVLAVTPKGTRAHLLEASAISVRRPEGKQARLRSAPRRA